MGWWFCFFVFQRVGDSFLHPPSATKPKVKVNLRVINTSCFCFLFMAWLGVWLLGAWVFFVAFWLGVTSHTKQKRVAWVAFGWRLFVCCVRADWLFVMPRVFPRGGEVALCAYRFVVLGTAKKWRAKKRKPHQQNPKEEGGHNPFLPSCFPSSSFPSFLPPCFDCSFAHPLLLFFGNACSWHPCLLG